MEEKTSFAMQKMLTIKAVVGYRGIIPYGLTPLHYLPIMLYFEELSIFERPVYTNRLGISRIMFVAYLISVTTTVNTVIKRAETVKASP